MKSLKIFFVAAALAVPVIALTSCKRDAPGGAQAQAARYHCPMHPTYTSDAPGDCPICGMRLVPIETKPASAAPAASKYVCPMHPEETSDKPAECSKCGMNLEPVVEDHSTHAGASGGVPGQAPVEVSAERQQLIGVRTSKAEKRPLVRVVRASARVAYDPDLYAAIAEYREAVKARVRTKDSQWPDVKERAETLVRSAALRLRQLGISERQIDGMTEENDATNLLLGRPGGNVWVYAQVYEQEASLVKAGQTLVATTSSAPGKRFKGSVVAVDSILNPETRTLRVRAEVPNPEGVLKPEMYLDAAIEVALGERLSVPIEAVMDTGTRQLVFVATKPGVFDPREVTTGREAEGFIEILRGVAEGETVVTSANFLIDSESRLKAALSGSGAGGHSH